MTRLDQVSGDRDNNFNLLRLGAATMVVLGHAILLSGNRTSSLGWALGYTAVNCFFVISGFLVCRSLLTRAHLPSYLAARALRIYPALLVAVLVCVFGLGLWLTPMNPPAFLEHDQTRRFLWHNSLLFVGPVEVHLPAVFPGNPFPGQVNAPLWTLQYELGMYLSLACFYALARLLPASRRKQFLTAVIVITALACFTAFLANVASPSPRTGITANAVRFGAMFFSGAAFYLFRRHIPLSHRIALLLCGLIFISTGSRALFVCAFWLSLPYLLLYVAYVPGGVIRSFNRLGDYSYGLYIYAFPVQQLLVGYWPEIGGPVLFLGAMLLTLPLAVCSWHGLERPMLSLRRALPGRYSRASMIR
jgi:peptidoglycan/LPS O-acetylase OafA/YrhL